ncbi:hypothetical protein KGY73_08925 [bacterium]|nr:hypothetical protein [bacterium]
MKILIIGGTRFFGYHLARRFLEDGHDLSFRNSISPFTQRWPFILDVRRAQRDLGYSSTPFKQWMERTVRWFREDYQGGPPPNYKFRGEEIQLIHKYQKAIQSIIGDSQSRRR